MTSFTTIAASDLLPGEPWTAGKASANYNNPIAIAELDSTAPKIKVSVENGVAAAGSPFVTDGCANFDGVCIRGSINNISSGTDALQIELSEDGASYSAATTIASVVSGSLAGEFSLDVDLATGNYSGWYNGAATPGTISGTIAGGSADVSHVRLSMSVGSNNTYARVQRVGEII